MTAHTNAPLFLLVAVDGEQQLLIDRELVAGRDTSCAIVLGQGQASRQHAKLRPAADGIAVEDLQSTNGTFVNNQRISAVTLLKVGDELRIGPARFTVKLQPAAAPLDPDATMLYKPGNTLNNAGSAKPEKPLAETQPETAVPKAAVEKVAMPKAAAESLADSKAPPSWVLNNQQSVDGTKFISKDVMQSIMSQSNPDVGKLKELVKEPTLIGTSDPIVGMRFQLLGEDKNQWEIGRSPNSDIMINHDSVSSSHSQIIRDGKRWKLVDLMSANGTFVNGKKCLTGYLSSGDSVRFGSIECSIVFPGGSTESASAGKTGPGKTGTGKTGAGKGADEQLAGKSRVKVAVVAFIVTLVVAGAALYAMSRWL